MTQCLEKAGRIDWAGVPPVKVSPLIKLGRWVSLICGIFYGTKKKRRYSALEQQLKLEEEQKKILKEDFLEVEKNTILDESTQTDE